MFKVLTQYYIAKPCKSLQSLVHGRNMSKIVVKRDRKKGWTTVKPAALVVGATFGTAGLAYYFTRTESEKRFIRVTLGGIVRFFRSSTIGLMITLDYLWTPWGIPEADPAYVETLSAVHQRSAERILNGCLKNGGLYIKLGQGLVVMDHILPMEYIDTLRVLQDKCLNGDKEEIHQVFREDFGKSIKDLFESFDEEPIAAASLAQVFRARSKTGEELAIKVQYVDLQDRFMGDIATLRILLTIAGLVHKDFDFAWVLNVRTVEHLLS